MILMARSVTNNSYKILWVHSDLSTQIFSILGYLVEIDVSFHEILLHQYYNENACFWTNLYKAKYNPRLHHGTVRILSINNGADTDRAFLSSFQLEVNRHESSELLNLLKLELHTVGQTTSFSIPWQWPYNWGFVVIL